MKRILFILLLLPFAIKAQIPPAGAKIIRNTLYTLPSDSSLYLDKGTTYGWERLPRFLDVQKRTLNTKTITINSVTKAFSEDLTFTVGGGGGGSGTVVSVGKVDGYGITSSITNPTTTPVITLSVDSTSSNGVVSKSRLTAYAYSKAQDDALLANKITNGTSAQTADFNITGNGQAASIGLGVAPSSKVHIKTDALAGTAQDASGVLMTNTTPAVSGTQQVSPALVQAGYGWKTTATAASQEVRFRSYVRPVQGTANPTGNLLWESNINGAGYATALTLASNGLLTMPSAKVSTAPTNPTDVVRKQELDLKQNLVTLTTTGTSGASTFNQSTGALNIPNYAYTFNNGLTNTSGTVQLGGNLTKTTLINPSGFSFNIIPSGVAGPLLTLSDTGTLFGSVNSSGTLIQGFQFDPNVGASAMQVTDLINTKGLIYTADYSANFTARSLVDKAYSDGANTLSGAGTLTLSTKGWYTFTGTTATWTLPTLASSVNVTYYIKNRGSGNVTINSNAGGSDIYITSAVTSVVVGAGASIILHNDSGFWTVN